ncbi:MAG: hypothetical protein R6U28_09415 [Cyclonatronaceae bacterium]
MSGQNRMDKSGEKDGNHIESHATDATFACPTDATFACPTAQSRSRSP